jgi:hypothetical protein
VFPQVVDKRCARNYALSFDGPESPQRPDRAPRGVKPLWVDGSVRCSFCGKSKGRVEKLIVGSGVYICNECIELGIRIMAEERDRAPVAAHQGDEDAERAHDVGRAADEPPMV